MYFFIKNEKLLKKYHETWNKDSNSIIKRFDSEPVYNEKYLKTKIKSYKGKININFNNKKIPKECSQCNCLSVILINSISETGKNYYPQVFLEECNMLSKKKMPEYITDDIKVSPNILMKKILIKKIPRKKILMKKILFKTT